MRRDGPVYSDALTAEVAAATGNSPFAETVEKNGYWWRTTELMNTKNASMPPSMDGLLDVLANRYRRRLLVALLEHNPQDDVPRIPADVRLTDEDLESLRLSMTHKHLPKMENRGFIEWDRDTHTVRRGPRFEEIRPMLELLHDHADELPDRWS